MFWHDRLLEDAEDLEVLLQTDCSVLLCLTYRTKNMARMAMMWWTMSFGLHAPENVMQIKDTDDIRAAVQLGRALLKQSMYREVKSSAAFVLASQDSVDHDMHTENAVYISIVLDAPDFVLRKRARDSVRRDEELHGSMPI
jgi:hypothetical protein